MTVPNELTRLQIELRDAQTNTEQLLLLIEELLDERHSGPVDQRAAAVIDSLAQRLAGPPPPAGMGLVPLAVKTLARHPRLAALLLWLLRRRLPAHFFDHLRSL